MKTKEVSKKNKNSLHTNPLYHGEVLGLHDNSEVPSKAVSCSTEKKKIGEEIVCVCVCVRERERERENHIAVNG